MKEKLTLFLLIVCCYTLNAEMLARVDVVGGCRVFAECTPVAKYEVLGEINLAYTPTVSSSSYKIGDFSMNLISTSKPYYNEIRDGLITQGIMANREVNGIIINGQKGTLIRFSNDEENTDLAIPNRRNGMYLFVDSHPIEDYNFIGKITAGLVDDNFQGIINSILHRANKKLRKKEYNGAIFHWVKDGSYAEIICIHTK